MQEQTTEAAPSAETTEQKPLLFQPFEIKRNDVTLLFGQKEKKRGKASGDIYAGADDIDNIDADTLIKFFGPDNVKDILAQRLNGISQTVYSDVTETLDAEGNVVGQKPFEGDVLKTFIEALQKLSTGTGETIAVLEEKKEKYVAQMTALYKQFATIAGIQDINEKNAMLAKVSAEAESLTNKINDVGANIASRSKKKKKPEAEDTAKA